MKTKIKINEKKEKGKFTKFIKQKLL